MKFMEGTKDPQTRNTLVFNNIHEAVDRVDWDTIADAMSVLGWQYIDGAPTGASLKKDMLDRYERIINLWDSVPVQSDGSKESSLSSGGFIITIRQYPDDDPMISVNFSISDSILLKDIK